MGAFKEGFLAGLLGGDAYMSYKTRQAVIEQTRYQIEQARYQMARDFRADQEREQADRERQRERYMLQFSTQLAPLMPQIDVAVSRVFAAFEARDTTAVQRTVHETALLAAPASAIIDALYEGALDLDDVGREWFEMLVTLGVNYGNWVQLDSVWAALVAAPTQDDIAFLERILRGWNDLGDRLEAIVQATSRA